MSDNKVTLDQLDNSAVEAMSSSVGDVNMLNTENKTIVGAISEIVGKKEIADAIGEPLAETDKFTEMGSEINGLLSTFKTNMMNAGVVVESGDKFKALIDKIKGLTEGEGNKGIQFATMIGSATYSVPSTNVKRYVMDLDIDFIPSYIFVDCQFNYSVDASYTCKAMINNINLPSFQGTNASAKISISSTDLIGNTLTWDVWGYYNLTNIDKLTYYAIGVGEEDTALRDSLASILENKGVDVTEEDDMASLITKVDSIQTGGGLDIISATELPSTGVENQICVITDNPVDNFLITSDTTHYNGDTNVIMAHTSITNNNVEPLVLINDNMTQYIHFFKMIQGNAVKKSYIYKNNEWIEYTPAELVLIRNGVIYNEMYKPGDYSTMGYDTTYEEGKGLTITVETDSYNYDVFSSYTRIDFSLYNTLFIKIKKLENYAHTCVALAVDSKPYGALNKDKGIAYTYSFSTPAGTTRELYIDVSTWTGEYYLAIGPEGTDNTYSFLVSDVYLY